jgi:hypothetical protein
MALNRPIRILELFPRHIFLESSHCLIAQRVRSCAAPRQMQTPSSLNPQLSLVSRAMTR